MTHLEVRSSVPGKSKPHIDVKMTLQTAQVALPADNIHPVICAGFLGRPTVVI